VPVREGPSLRPLFPSASIVLDVTGDGPVPAGAREAWVGRLRARLAAEEIVAAPAGTPGAVPVALRLTVEMEEGATDAGTPFLGARGRAILRVGRRSHEFPGRSFAGTERDALARKALDDLLDRVFHALAY